MEALEFDRLQHRAKTAVALSDFVEAEYCFRLLVSAKPKDANLLAGLGQALCWLKRKQEGRKFLLQAARQMEAQLKKSRDPRYAVELSQQLLHWGEVVHAERLARLALRLAPNSAVVLNNLVQCLTRVNRHAEALSIAQKVLQLLPDDPGCNILLALIEAKTNNSEQALQRLQRVIEQNTDPKQTARAQLEAGILLDKQGRYDQAFAQLELAAQAHSQYADYPPDQRDHLFEVLERNQQHFDQDLLRRWQAEQIDADGLPSPVFLMGFLRSGTTLTEQVLDAHPRIIATDESSILFETSQRLEQISGIVNDQASALRRLTLEQIGQLRQFYWQRMQTEYGPQVISKVLIDKNALNTIELGLIGVLFPNAKIIFALRDPRDVCLSCYMQAFSPSPATINLLSWNGIAKQYQAVMDYWLHLRPWLQAEVMQLRYEDTVLDFEASFRGVFDFLELPWSNEVSRFHERLKGRYISTPSFSAVSQPIYTTALQRWKNYPSHFDGVMPHLQKFIDEFGYA